MSNRKIEDSFHLRQLQSPTIPVGSAFQVL